MDDNVLNLLIRISQKIAFAKVSIGEMAQEHPAEYMKIRKSLDEIVDEMSDFCNCPPAHLVFGKVKN